MDEAEGERDCQERNLEIGEAAAAVYQERDHGRTHVYSPSEEVQDG